MKKPTTLLFLFALAAFASVASAQLPTVSITAPDDSAAETLSGQPPNPGLIRVARTGPTSSSLFVAVRVRGTATQGVDYAFPSTINSYVTIPAGQSHLDIPVTVIDDWLTEGAETVRLELQDSTAYVNGISTRGQVDIADNEDPLLPPRAVVTVAAVDAQATETLSGAPADTATFRISREGNVTVALTVNYTLSGSASNGVDYAALSGSVALPAGVVSADVVIAVIDDAEIEGTETVALAIAPSGITTIPSPAEAYVIGVTSNATTQISDNDFYPPPVVTITAPSVSAVAIVGQPIDVTFTASNAGAYITSYLVSGGTGGTSGVSTNTTPGAAFSGSATLTFQGLNTQQYSVQVTDSRGNSAVATRTIYVINPPVTNPPVVPTTYSLFAVSNATETAAGEAPKPGKFLFVRTGTPVGLEIFSYSFSGAARQGIDYTVSYGPWIYSTNNTTNVVQQEITINPIDDAFVEGDETVKVELCFVIITWIESGGAGAPTGTYCTGNSTNANAHATIVIHDNDTNPPPNSIVTVVATDPEASEISPQSGLPPDPGVFTITRTAPTTNDLTVNYALLRPPVTPSAATRIAANGADYETLSGTVVIPAGSTSAEVVVNPIFDALLEGDEAVTLTLVPNTNAAANYLLDLGGANSATVVIRDYAPTNVPVVRIRTIDSQAIEELNAYSRTATLVVERNLGLSNALTVTYSISGSASNGVDYVTLPGFVTIPAGSNGSSIVIDPIADGITEPIESVGLTLQSAPLDVFPPAYLLNAIGIASSSAGATIRDTLLYPSHPYLTRAQRVFLYRHRNHVVVPLPMTSFTDPSVPPPPEAVAKTWAVEASTDLASWQQIGTTQDPEEYVDVTADDLAQRFYRFREVPPSP